MMSIRYMQTFSIRGKLFYMTLQRTTTPQVPVMRLFCTEK